MVSITESACLNPRVHGMGTVYKRSFVTEQTSTRLNILSQRVRIATQFMLYRIRYMSSLRLISAFPRCLGLRQLL